MSSLSLIRSYIETRVAAAFPGVTIVYQNVQETPPNFPYVICLINYPSTTEPVICQTESMVEQLRGNLQLSCYVDRGLGMKALEAMGVGLGIKVSCWWLISFSPDVSTVESVLDLRSV